MFLDFSIPPPFFVEPPCYSPKPPCFWIFQSHPHSLWNHCVTPPNLHVFGFFNPTPILCGTTVLLPQTSMFFKGCLQCHPILDTLSYCSAGEHDVIFGWHSLGVRSWFLSLFSLNIVDTSGWGYSGKRGGPLDGRRRAKRVPVDLGRATQHQHLGVVRDILLQAALPLRPALLPAQPAALSAAVGSLWLCRAEQSAQFSTVPQRPLGPGVHLQPNLDPSPPGSLQSIWPLFFSLPVPFLSNSSIWLNGWAVYDLSVCVLFWRQILHVV